MWGKEGKREGEKIRGEGEQASPARSLSPWLEGRFPNRQRPTEGRMSDDKDPHQPRSNLRVVQKWRTTSNLMEKAILDRIADEATKYDLLRDGEFVHQCFGGGPMTPEIFRRQLQLAFHMKLSDAELADAVRILDKNKNGLIESEEFLKAFFEMGAAEKARRHRVYLDKKRQVQERRKEEAIKKEKEAQDKAARVVIKDFKQEDLDSAIAKVKQAALLYDRHHPSSVQLSAFEGQYMEPYIFKDQLRKCFGIHLSAPEFGALLSCFDKEHKGVVDCVEFLVTFFRTGFAEKAKLWIYRRDRDLRKQEARIREEKKRKEEADAKNALKVKYDFTPEEEKSALKKLTEAACRFDRNAPGCMSLDAFEGKDMPPHVFKEQLKMTFNLKVTPGELGALMHSFDRDQSGSVSTSEFLVDFFRRGFRKRNEDLKTSKMKQHRKMEQRKREEEEKKAQADAKNALQVTHDFGEADFTTAVQKVTEAAIKYDKYHPSSIPLTAFEGASLQPHEFKEQLRRVFNITLTAKELGALMAFFDKDKDGTVACNEFLIMFFKTGFKERNRIRREWRRRQAKLIELKVLKHKEEQEALDRKNALKVNSDYAQGDFDAAIGKITEAAAKYDRYHPSAVQLDAFEGASMPPHIFKEQLRRVFNVKLCPKELGAVMSHFDKDASGEIDCAEFLLEFFKLGFEERTRRIKIYRRKQALHAERVKKEAAMRVKIDLSKANSAAMPFTEEDLDSAASKLIDTAIKYSRRNLGIVGLKAFDVGNMTPGEFQRQLHHTFYLDLTPGEMGAVTAYFDLDHNGSISITEFLAQFFRISVVAKAFVGKSDFRSRVRELKEQIKEQVRQRRYNFDSLKVDVTEEDQQDLDDGHRRSAGPETDDDEGGHHYNYRGRKQQQQQPPAVTPRSKLERRLSRGESDGGRLDLSTYKEPREGVDFCLSTLPAKALDLRGLKELWLTNNSLSELPPSLALLKQLRILSLTGNKLVSLPKEMTALCKLQRLYADRNLLEDIPASLLLPSALSLRELKLDHNKLTTFPPVLPALRNLEILGLSHNLITSLVSTTAAGPFCRGKLPHLESLDLDHNQLSGPFPSHLLTTLAPSLRTLSAFGNTKLQGYGPPLEEELWSMFSKLQNLRLATRASIVRPRRRLPTSSSSSWEGGGSNNNHEEGSKQHHFGGGGDDHTGMLFLGEQLVGMDSDLGGVLHTVIKKRKLVSSNYIVRKEI